ncbi:MAG: flagellar motor protein MotB [Lachnospiraceae bacterium]|nr:flagellar motor protein MotB [Lachnospiraceae bacterium]
MAKKKEDPPPAGSPAWMATFSDLMNLLLCFFVMLFSMSTMDEAKLKEVVASMNSAFSVLSGGATSIGDGILISNGVSQLNELSEYINSTGKTADSDSETKNIEQYDNDPQGLKELLEQQQLESNEAMAEQVEEEIGESNMSDQIEVTFTAQYVQLTMKGGLLFDSGSDVVKEESKKYLDKVGTILTKYADGIIEIEGHTDNVPMSSARFPSNEELSDARALSVFYYLVDTTSLSPQNMKHAGMGERVPIADNSTVEGRSKNRRVEIRIYNDSL